MRKIRRKVSFLLMTAMLLSLLSIPTFAANSDFNFSLSETGRTFNRDTRSSNTKTNASSGWVYNVQYIKFSDTANLGVAYGMAFSPMKYMPAGASGAGYYATGNISWSKTTGRKTATYGSAFGGTGEYFLGARLDDYLSGTGTAVGVWNADSW